MDAVLNEPTLSQPDLKTILSGSSSGYTIKSATNVIGGTYLACKLADISCPRVLIKINFKTKPVSSWNQVLIGWCYSGQQYWAVALNVQDIEINKDYYFLLNRTGNIGEIYDEDLNIVTKSSNPGHSTTSWGDGYAIAVCNGSLNVNYVKAASVPVGLKLTTKIFAYIDKDESLYGIV